jgi:phosphate transport system protein
MLGMGSLVADQLREALAVIAEQDFDKAAEVVTRDKDVDATEVKIDDEIARLIARRSPVGSDLRLVLSVSKSVTDLERMGDEAVRIACMVRSIHRQDNGDAGGQMLRDVANVGRLVLQLLEHTLDCFARQDVAVAEQIASGYNELEMEFQSSLRRMITFVLEDSHNVGLAVSVVTAIRSLGRLGDHARNMAEYVIYLVRGEDVRHQEPGIREGAEDLSDIL